MKRFAVLSSLMVVPLAVGVLTIRPKTAGPHDGRRPSTVTRLDSDAIRVMTYNLAHGRALSLHQAMLRRTTIRRNIANIGSLVRRYTPDFVAAQELDGPSAWSARFDHAAALGQLSGLAHVFRGRHGRGLGPFVLDYGTGILSQWPLQQCKSAAFDTNWRDNKGFVTATVAPPQLGGRQLDVVSVHLDFLSADVRARQLDRLATALEPRERPLIVLGDFNCALDEVDCLPHFIRRLGLSVDDSSVAQATFPADSAQAQIDWILISEELEFRSYETAQDQLSDHLAVVADVALRRSEPAPHHATPKGAKR